MRAVLVVTFLIVVGLSWCARPAAGADEPLLQLVEANVALRAQVEELTSSVSALQAELTSLRATVEQRTPPAQPPTLQERIAAYRRNGGVPWYVNGGNTSQEHLIHAHGWSASQLRGLTHSELNDLHGASHTGQITPSLWSQRASPVPEPDRVTVTACQPARSDPRGRWVRRCIDGQCRLIWEPDD